MYESLTLTSSVEIIDFDGALNSKGNGTMEILTFLSMKLENLIALIQRSIKYMLGASISQIGYAIIGKIVRDSNNGYASIIK